MSTLKLKLAGIERLRSSDGIPHPGTDPELAGLIAPALARTGGPRQ